jgi:hypothetical protein
MVVMRLMPTVSFILAIVMPSVMARLMVAVIVVA